MDFKQTNKAKDWVLYVYEQSKIEDKNMVKLRCNKSGRKIGEKDGKAEYDDPMFIDVLVNADTKWPEADLSRKRIVVSGGFSHSFFTTKEGEKRMTFTIFADEIAEYVYES